ncbi:hypothetical protein [Musicola paradisiaca]|uniref:hypothetical protein n=1 Tax=Musicola paradisiaca TaxID=69223 RepID=UPI001294081A|nr:hypothetical protein [Musicola paradisiaca]
MTESFCGHNSQHFCSLLPLHQSGESVSRLISLTTHYPFNPVFSRLTAKADANRSSDAVMHRFFPFYPLYGLIREPTLFVNETPSAKVRSVTETNCKVPLWEDKKQ